MVSSGVDWWISEFGLGDELAEYDTIGRRLVLVPVGGLDLRAVRPVELAWRIPAQERRAVHVVTDEAAATELATGWMQRDLSFPLYFVENKGGVAETIASLVTLDLCAGFDEVVVLAGRLDIRRRRYRLLHDRTADAIGRRL